MEGKCSYCGKKIVRPPSSFKRSKNLYCGKECADNDKRNKVDLTCLTCGKIIKVWASQIKNANRKYCSVKCFADSKKRRIKQICKFCGKEFETKKYIVNKGWGNFCSKECHGKYKSQVKRIKCKCGTCGKEFEATPYQIKNGRGKFCSKKCFTQHQTTQIIKTCEICGKEFKTLLSNHNRGKGKLCSNECRGKFLSANFKGETHPAWKGGLSFEPYCSKFNNEFKERVREFWGRKCGICGLDEKRDIERIKRKLSIHHVNYEKMVCCDDTPPLFIPLCASCHAKTNIKRTFWECLLTEYIMIYFNGESYNKK